MPVPRTSALAGDTPRGRAAPSLSDDRPLARQRAALDGSDGRRRAVPAPHRTTAHGPPL